MNPTVLAQRIDEYAKRVIVVGEAPCKTCGEDGPILKVGETCPACGKRRGGARYKCAETGKPIPGVTTILGDMIAKPQLVWWSAKCAVEHIESVIAEGGVVTAEVLAEARRAHTVKRDQGADIGSQAHDCLQAWLSGDAWDTYLPEDRDARKSVEAGLAWLERIRPQVVAVEAVCADPAWGGGPTPKWCGRTDLVYLDDQDRLVVADWKSTKSGLYPESFLQLAAYAISVEAATGERVDRVELIHIDRETGGFRVATRSGDEFSGDYLDFLKLVRVRRRMTERGRVVRDVMSSDPITAMLVSEGEVAV